MGVPTGTMLDSCAFRSRILNTNQFSPKAPWESLLILQAMRVKSPPGRAEAEGFGVDLHAPRQHHPTVPLRDRYH